MGIINIGYMLLGAFFFISLKIVYNIEWFKKDSHQGFLHVFYFIFGCLMILSGLNSIAYQIINGWFDYLYLLPIILAFLSGVIYISDLFINPSKNSMYSLLLGTIIATILYFILYYILCGIIRIQEYIVMIIFCLEN